MLDAIQAAIRLLEGRNVLAGKRNRARLLANSAVPPENCYRLCSAIVEGDGHNPKPLFVMHTRAIRTLKETLTLPGATEMSDQELADLLEVAYERGHLDTR